MEKTGLFSILSFFCIHATMFLPADSELHLWIIWHFFWQQELGGNFKAPFPDKHDYQYLNTLPIFQKLLVLVRGCTGAGLSCCAFFFEFPQAPKERIQCVLHFTLRELLGVTRFWWSLLPLTTVNTGPVLVNNDKNTRALIHKLTLQSNYRDRRKICTSLCTRICSSIPRGRTVVLRFILPYNLSFLWQREILRLIRKNLLGRDLKSADSSC